MALSNVNVGTGPSAGNGDSLRSAFITINNNFTELNANVEAISHPVNSVAGRTGDVILTKNDIIGLRDGDSGASPNASTVSSWITSNIAAIVDSAPDALNTLNEIAAAIQDDANIATTLTNSITTANVNMKGYVDGQVTTINSTITTANVNVVGYTDDAISTANVNVVGYVDNAVSTANVNLKGYADATFLTSFTETNDLTSAVTWTNIPDANVPSSAVTQHQANLSITESQISDLQSYLTSYTETNDLTAAVTWADIPDANVPQSAVTQYQANLSITESQISDLGTYVESDTTGITGADQVTNMVSLTQAEYDAITPNASTVHIIVG